MEAAPCPRCGAPAPAGAARCPSCATPLRSDEPGPTPSGAQPGSIAPTAPPAAAGSLADPEGAWVPPDASSHPTTQDPSQGWVPPQPGPRGTRRLLLAGAGGLVLVVVLVGVVAWTARSPRRAPARPATATAGGSTTAQPGLRVPDTLGGLPREVAPIPLPTVAGGQVVTGYYGSPDNRQFAMVVAARPGVARPAAQTAEFFARDPYHGTPGTFRRYPRDGLEVRCADVKGRTRQVVAAVCYLDQPDLEVVVNGAPSARIPDLVAEAYHKIKP
jgi:hypothetical protein